MMNTKMMNAMDLLNKGNFNEGVIAKALYSANIAAIALEVLETSGKPMRVKEILPYVDRNATSQKVSAILRSLVSAGAVQRIETDEKEFVPFGDDGFGKMLPIVKFAKV